MKRITLLYFAAVRDLLGSSEEAVELPDAVANVGELSRHLERRHPELSGRLRGVRFAVNEVFADAATPLAQGDVVAVIPPVAGG